ncbi:hypothetical protein GCK32_007386 [Trichostrongylus colubriformis]|uniref:Uncharacterized protein n=1 Tax=Trichostrongylus colubriformis TaxID=6319 RepID=A0AAN8J355_TRICO
MELNSEQVLRPNGVITVRKSCSPTGQYQFDDGTLMINLNQCVTKSSTIGQYYVLLCTSGDECNSQCVTTSPPNPPNPTPSPGTVTCYNCVSYDGNECQTNVCQGNYCVYERRISGNQIMIRKGCSETSTARLDDGTVVDVVGICEIRNTLNSQYFVKVCNDSNFCNNYCNPPTTIEPQRQRQRRLATGTTYVKKSCTNLPFIEYPDNRPSTALNTCETRTIGGVQYQVRVCNSGNNCNVACPAEEQQLVTCYQCEADQVDCNTGSCQGNYCLFTRTQSATDVHVKKSCTTTDNLLYVDNVQYTSFGNCEYRQVNGVAYTFKLCNSSSYCNVGCPAGPIPSQLSSCSTISTTLIFLTIFLLQWCQTD